MFRNVVLPLCTLFFFIGLCCLLLLINFDLFSTTRKAKLSTNASLDELKQLFIDTMQMNAFQTVDFFCVQIFLFNW